LISPLLHFNTIKYCSSFQRPAVPSAAVRMPKIIRYPCFTDMDVGLEDVVVVVTEDAMTLSKPDCPICMEPLEIATRIKPCHHNFHFDCIQSWVYAQEGRRKYCPCCRKRMTTLQKMDSHGCCILSQSISRMLRPPTPPQVHHPQAIADAAVTADRQIRAQMQELEIFEQMRLAAEAEQLEAFNRYEQERRASDIRAEEQRLEWERSTPPPIVSCTMM